MSKSPHYRYLLIQRCKPFGVWPDDFIYQDDHRLLKVCIEKMAYNLTLRFGVKTYADHLFAPDSEGNPPHVGRMVHDQWHRQGFWLGNARLLAAGETVGVQVKFRNVERGEIDFFVGIDCENDVPTETLKSLLSPVLTTFISTFSVRLGDIIVATAPHQLYRLGDNGEAQMDHGMMAAVRSRPTIADTGISSAFPAFFETWNKLSPEDSRRVGVAMRRYQNSMSEADPVDRFCDLWEVCEFLAKCIRKPNGRAVGGKIDSVIAYGVGLQIDRKPDIVLRRIVKPLYDMRKDLVHNAIEDASKFIAMTSVLERVAVQLIRFTFAMGAEPDAQIDRLLSS